MSHDIVIFQNAVLGNVFGKMKNLFLAKSSFSGKRFWETIVLRVENRNKIQEVRLCEKRATKVDVKRSH